MSSLTHWPSRYSACKCLHTHTHDGIHWGCFSAAAHTSCLYLMVVWLSFCARGEQCAGPSSPPSTLGRIALPRVRVCVGARQPLRHVVDRPPHPAQVVAERCRTTTVDIEFLKFQDDKKRVPAAPPHARCHERRRSVVSSGVTGMVHTDRRTAHHWAQQGYCRAI